jgi:hypothetical protein
MLADGPAAENESCRNVSRGGKSGSAIAECCSAGVVADVGGKRGGAVEAELGGARAQPERLNACVAG